MIAPSKSPITPGYGFGSTLPPYSASNPHMGVDFQHSPDDGIYAPEDGTISSRIRMGDCGEAAELTSNNKHRFCHASQWYVSAGDKVKQGQLIGKMGETGAAAGVHLHWILWVNGKIVDGMKYVTEEDKMSNDAIEKFVSKCYRVATDVDPTPEQANYWVERIKNNQDTAFELPIALGADDYKGDPKFRYKGRHYSEDMTTAKKQAYDQGVKDSGGDFKPVNKTLYEKG